MQNEFYAIMMRKSIIVGLMTFALCGFTAVGWSAEYNFRKIRWGMSPEEVLASEKLKPSVTGNRRIEYQAKILEKKVVIIYFFVNKKLICSKYVLAEDHIIENKYLRDYNDFKAILSRKYGMPIKSDVVWDNGAYFKNDPSRYGVAVSNGRLSFFDKWENEYTEIESVLKGGNFNISCEIEYSSRKLKDLKAQLNKKSLDRLGQGNKKTDKKIQKAMEDF